MPALSPRDARLTLAVEAGLVPEAGTIAVFRPTADDWFGPLAPARLRIVTGYRPDFDALAARGLECAAPQDGPGTGHAAALVCLSRARGAARDLIAQAQASTTGPVLVDGQKTDGIDAMLRECRARGQIGDPVVKAHGKLFILPKGADFADWRAAPSEVASGFVTLPGVFSADGVDPGSAALAAALPGKLPGRMADLGAGWGWLSAQVLARAGVESLDLIEAEAEALACARRNLAATSARFHWADALTFRPEVPFQGVVMNPPFHAGRAGDPALGQAFVAAAARMLTPGGTLWMVANRHLPYGPTLEAHFREIEELPCPAPGFRVTRASGPRPKPVAPAAPRRVQRSRR